MSPIAVFLSYAHHDDRLRQELDKHLSPLRRTTPIDVWHDRRIGPGAKLHQELDRHLATADLILLLISPDFINSDFCYCRELKTALLRHAKGLARVIPIILRPVEWKTTPIGNLLATPKDGKPVINWQRRDDALLDVATRVREVVEEMIASRGGAMHGLGRQRPTSGTAQSPAIRQRRRMRRAS